MSCTHGASLTFRILLVQLHQLGEVLVPFFRGPPQQVIRPVGDPELIYTCSGRMNRPCAKVLAMRPKHLHGACAPPHL